MIFVVNIGEIDRIDPRLKGDVPTLSHLLFGTLFKNGTMVKHFNFKHGECLNGKISKLYRVWESMVRRTSDQQDDKFNYYGGRGISVCDEWKNPGIFFEWAKNNGYKQGLFIDRINNDGNYCPENCRFVDKFISAQNKRKRKNWGLLKRGNSYQVCVTHYGKIYKPGSSTNLEEALSMRNNILKKLNRYEDIL